MSDCNHDCGSCSANCGSRTQEQTNFLEPLYRESSVKKVIGIVQRQGRRWEIHDDFSSCSSCNEKGTAYSNSGWRCDGTIHSTGFRSA